MQWGLKTAATLGSWTCSLLALLLRLEYNTACFRVLYTWYYLAVMAAFTGAARALRKPVES